MRQKARLHCAQDELAARGSRERARAADASVLPELPPAGCRLGGGDAGASFCGPRGMMVLLVKQVHLQNVGAARERERED